MKRFGEEDIMFDAEDLHFWFSTSDGIPLENMHNEADSWTASKEKYARLDERLGMAATEIKFESDWAKLEPMPSYANDVALFKKNCDYKLQESSGQTKIVKKKVRNCVCLPVVCIKWDLFRSRRPLQ